jgi:hypothetical protein
MGGGESKSGHQESHYMDYHPNMHGHAKIINHGDVGSHGGHSKHSGKASGAKVDAKLSVPVALINLEDLDLMNLQGL